ncbi:hypothetical protein IAE22_28505, partial [Bacillus sp. S34]|nr:hypothetical protein [Bacillus sp. S34]
IMTTVRATRAASESDLLAADTGALDRMAESVHMPADLIRLQHAVPSYYLRYFYSHDVVLEEQLRSGVGEHRRQVRRQVEVDVVRPELEFVQGRGDDRLDRERLRCDGEHPGRTDREQQDDASSPAGRPRSASVDSSEHRGTQARLVERETRDMPDSDNTGRARYRQANWGPAEGDPMTRESTYVSAPNVAPIKINTFRQVRRRVRRGDFEELANSLPEARTAVERWDFDFSF